MAINQAVCATFKQQLLDGDHDISSDTVNLALYTSSAITKLVHQAHTQQAVQHYKMQTSA
jgi:hypothetical protein